MKLLITGSTGFIGSNLVSELSKDVSLELYCICSPKNQAPQSKKNLTYIQCDLSQRDFVNKIPANIDVVIHLAQSSEYRNFPDKANDIFNINVRSTQLLLDWSRKNGIKRFIFSSTGNVYKTQNKLLNENDPCEPLGYYGASKFAAEQLIKPYSMFFDTIILRIFGVYGPGQKNMTIPNIIEKVKNSEEITLAKNIGLFFTPIYIKDCIEILKKIILTQPKNKYKVYNLSGNKSLHLGELVQIISEITSIPSNVRKTENDPMYLMGDNTSLMRDFGVNLSTDIKNGVEKILKYE